MIKAKRLNTSAFNSQGGAVESDGNGGTKMYKQGQNNATTTLECYKYWGYGGKSKWFDNMTVSYSNITISQSTNKNFDDVQAINVLIIEKHQDYEESTLYQLL